MDFSSSAAADSRDRIFGTLLRDTATSNRVVVTFCGVCKDKERNNQFAKASASWLEEPRPAQHRRRLGRFHQLRVEDSYQSGSNFRLWGDFFVGDQFYFRANPATQVAYHPLLEETALDFAVSSLFVNTVGLTRTSASTSAFATTRRTAEPVR
jgi:hypothetical protein